ncbi:MAG: hypothetical protein ACON5H_04860 [Akkermansiaceae bacterium]
MNKSYLIHGVWVIVAIAAYAFGSRSSSSPENRSSDQASSSSTVTTRISDRGSSEASGSPASKRRGTRGSSEEKTLTLSESAIINLGTDFKTASNLLERRAAFSKILEALTPENATLLREQIAHLDQDSQEFREFHYAWGMLAGETAVQHGAETRKRDMAASLAGWVSKDPDTAMAYFNSLTEDQKRGGGMKWGAVFGLLDSDPSRAVDFVKEQSEAGDRDARRMMNLALDRILEGGDLGNAESVARSIEGTKLETSAYRHLAWKISESDPAGAADWATGLAQSEGRNHAIGTSYNRWAGEDPQAAAAKISTLTDPEARDAATYGYATRVVWDDPATGVEWAASIRDESSRNRALVDTGRAYFRKDPEGAKAWLQTSGLSNEQQKRISKSRK